MAKQKTKKTSVLPDAPTIESSAMTDYRWMIHSDPKVGKTALANEFPGALILRAERGTLGLAAHCIDVDQWSDVLDAVDALMNEKHSFETVVFDRIELMYEMLYDSVVEEENAHTGQNLTHISEIGYAKGYRTANSDMEFLLNELHRRARMCVVLLSLSRLVEDASGNVQIFKQVPNLSASPRKTVMGWVDACVYLDVVQEVDTEGQERLLDRRIYLQPAEDFEVGGRSFDYMPDWLSIMPTPVAGFARLKKTFEKAVGRKTKELRNASKGE